jgi:hypothetical protein
LEEALDLSRDRLLNEWTAMVCNLGVFGSGTHCVGSCYSMEHAVLAVVTVWSTLYWQLLQYGARCTGSCYSMDHAVLEVVFVATAGA